MSDRPHVLLTNDDGIDAPGLAALYDALTDVARVTVVAPAGDESGVGRQHGYAVGVEDHEWGYALDGTPCDCVLFGLAGGLEDRPEVVVSGCNDGPNVGAFKLSRSGTVSAAMEAAFLDTPGIALSVYDRRVGNRAFDRGEFAEAGRLARHFVERTAGSDPFDAVDYLNVNVPAFPPAPGETRLTRPLSDYDVEVTYDGEVASLRKSFYDPVDPDREGDPSALDPRTDLGALRDGVTSVSGLGVGGDAVESDALAATLDAYDRS